MKDNAVRNLYPNAVTISETENGELTVIDDEGNDIEIDDSLVTVEVDRIQAEYDAQDYARSRASEYPPATDYLDGIVKGDQAQVDKYIADCLAVKTKYPKD